VNLENQAKESTPTEAHPSGAYRPMVELANRISAVPSAPSGVLRRRGVKSTVLALAISAMAVAAAGAFRRATPPPPERDARILVAPGAVGFAPGAPHWDQLKVGKVAAAQRRWSDPYPAHIRVDETKTSRVGAPLAGRVARVLVEIGQRVAVGTPLFSVASPDLATLQTERMKADLELATAKLALDRVSSIVQAQALPAKDEILAAQQLKEAELSHRVARARLGSLKVQAVSDNEYVVKSPRNGVVVEKSILPDQEIAIESNATPIVVADVSSVWAVAELFESDVCGIHSGTPARVIVDSAVIDAIVDTVAAAVDPDRHTVAVRITLPNLAGTLRPNTFAKVEFESQLDPNAVEIAATALVSDGAKQYVYVERPDGLFERRDVVVGPVREGRALVASGLRVGEDIAERGAVLIDNQLAITQ
jgi:membrane fusion protein, heavy metal efflux system